MPLASRRERGGVEVQKVIKNGQALRRGYTTGSCAAAAAVAATWLLLRGENLTQVQITLPGGQTAQLPVEVCWRQDSTEARVVKDAGDDPDVTHGMGITAQVRCAPAGIELVGGAGVGTVTQPGLQVPVGQPAINPAPRRMIGENLRRLCDTCGYGGGLQVRIGAENGAEIARETFNPRLGIVGGISILGTTGIVEPMSEQALTETIHLLIDRAKLRDPERVVLSPGNYGRDYCLEKLGLDLEDSIKFSNFIGDTLDYLVYRDFKQALLVGHVGKLVKVAGGVMNTHSSVADCRMEILAAHAAACGAPRALVQQLLCCNTTDRAVELLGRNALTEPVFAAVLERICRQIDYRTKGRLAVEVLLFGSGQTLLAQTDGAQVLAAQIRGEDR